MLMLSIYRASSSASLLVSSLRRRPGTLNKEKSTSAPFTPTRSTASTQTTIEQITHTSAQRSTPSQPIHSLNLHATLLCGCSPVRASLVDEQVEGNLVCGAQVVERTKGSGNPAPRAKFNIAHVTAMTASRQRVCLNLVARRTMVVRGVRTQMGRWW